MIECINPAEHFSGGKANNCNTFQLESPTSMTLTRPHLSKCQLHCVMDVDQLVVPQDVVDEGVHTHVLIPTSDAAATRGLQQQGGEEVDKNGDVNTSGDKALGLTGQYPGATSIMLARLRSVQLMP